MKLKFVKAVDGAVHGFGGTEVKTGDVVDFSKIEDGKALAKKALSTKDYVRVDETGEAIADAVIVDDKKAKK